jgi:hypothetical protein
MDHNFSKYNMYLQLSHKVSLTQSESSQVLGEAPFEDRGCDNVLGTWGSHTSQGVG